MNKEEIKKEIKDEVKEEIKKEIKVEIKEEISEEIKEIKQKHQQKEVKGLNSITTFSLSSYKKNIKKEEECEEQICKLAQQAFNTFQSV